MPAKTPHVNVFVGTRKGGFIFSSDESRQKWERSELMFKGWEVMHINLDPRDRRLFASAAHFVYGPTIHYSDDLGKTWTQARQSPALDRPSASGRPPSTPEEARGSRSPGRPAREGDQDLEHHPRAGQPSRACCTPGSSRRRCSNPPTAARPGY